MLSCCRNIRVSFLSFSLLFSLLPHFAYAAIDDTVKLGNNTIERTVQLRTHSLFAPYIDQDLQNRWWDFGADSYVNTNKHLRLTRSAPSQMGWLWSRLPLTTSNFIIEVEFKISGDSHNLYGDGMAVWLTTTRAQPGPVFGSINNFKGLGIFIDTYANARHSYSFPRISAMLGNGDTVYDYGNDGEGQISGACSANVRRSNVATKLKITYLKDMFLDVKVQHRAWDDWTDCFTLSPISLPPAPYVGFSAMTGDVFDSHDIITVTTSSAILSDPNSPRDKFTPADRKHGTSRSTWSGFLFKVFLFAGVCAGAYYAYNRYYGKRHGYAPSMFAMRGRGGFGDLYSSSKRF